jgi:hypothetical protein
VLRKARQLLASAVGNNFMTTTQKILIFKFLILCNLTVFCQDCLVDSSTLAIDSAIIEGEKYFAIYKTDNCFYIQKESKKIFFKSNEFSMFFEFSDFNEDGHKDIIISYLGNNPTKDLIVFDTKNKEFKPVENFSLYPEPKQILDSKYYYSYHRSGCADSNWESDIFIIENFRATKLGTISGRECEDSEEEKGIFVYRTNESKNILLEKFSVEIIEKFKNGKWDFIEEYWTKNLQKFECQ